MAQAAVDVYDKCHRIGLNVSHADVIGRFDGTDMIRFV